MILLLVIPFLMLGCAVFLICALIPLLRRFALSASLWCIALTPWLFALIVGLFVFAIAFGAGKNLTTAGLTHPFPINLRGPSRSTATILAYFLLIVAVIGSLVTATVAAILHQIAIHRITLALFRLYVAGVSLGIGILSSTFAVLAFGNSTYPGSPPFLFAFAIGLIASLVLAIACYKFAAQFRASVLVAFPSSRSRSSPRWSRPPQGGSILLPSLHAPTRQNLRLTHSRRPSCRRTPATLHRRAGRVLGPPWPLR